MPETTESNVVRGSLGETPPEFSPNLDISGGSRLFFGGMGEEGVAEGSLAGPSESATVNGAASVDRPAAGASSTAGNESVYVTTPALERQRQNGESFTLVPESSPEAPTSSMAFTWGGYFKALGVLLLLLVLFWMALRMLRRKGKGRFMPTQSLSRDDLFLEAHLPLGQNRSVAVVRFQDRRLVLGVTEQQINLLTESYMADGEADDSAEPDDPNEADFHALMRAGKQRAGQ